jgi:hypothetical protein
LAFEFLSEHLPELYRCIVVDKLLFLVREEFPHQLLRAALHSKQKPALVSFASRPRIYLVGDLLPAAKIEVTDTKISFMGYVKRIAQTFKKLIFDVIKYLGHYSSSLS